VLPDAVPGTPSMRITSGGTWKWKEFHMDASLRGFGNLLFSFYANHHEDSQYLLYGDNSRFYGTIAMQTATNYFLCITNECNLGAELPAFREDALSFAGGNFKVTNDVTLADVNRDIQLDAVSASIGVSCIFRAEDATFDIASPISGSGSLMINSPDGCVVLKGDNSYTGATTVACGSLSLESTNALGGSTAHFSSGTALVVRYPQAEALDNGLPVSDSQFSFDSEARVKITGRQTGANLGQSFKLPLFCGTADALSMFDSVTFEAPDNTYKITFSTKTLPDDTQVLWASVSKVGLLLMIQ
jgi:autotransporter-associated beta strand protein